MEHRPLIGILVPHRSSRKRILELYGHHRELNIELYAFTLADIFWRKQRIAGVYQANNGWREAFFPLPDAVYNRCYNKTAHIVHFLESIIGRHKCFNKINHFNKWTINTLLAQSHLKTHLPDTFLYNQVKFPDLFEKFNLLYIKPEYGNKGKRVHRVERKGNGDIYISLHSLAPRYICRKNEDVQGKIDELIGAKKYIVQQGIQSSQIDNCYFDLRALMQKNILGEWMVSTTACKVAYEGYFNTGIYKSIYDAESFLPQLFPTNEKGATLLQSLKEIGANAAQLFETHLGLLGELSVDFLLDLEGKLWIIEINGMPQKNIYKEIEGFRHNQLIYRRPLEYANYLSQT